MANRGKEMGQVNSDLDSADEHNGYAQQSLDDNDVEGAKEHFNHAKGLHTSEPARYHHSGMKFLSR